MTRRIPTAPQPATAPSHTPTQPIPSSPTPTSSQNTRTISSSKKVYVVTGANRGIGLELTRQLSRLPNSHIIATSRHPSPSPPASAPRPLTLLASYSGNITILPLDLSSSTSITAFGASVVKLAPHGVHALWNNAAQNSVKFTVDQEEDVDVEAWVGQLRVNVCGATEVTRALLDLLKRGQEEGEEEERQVVFIGSTAGSVTRATGKGTGIAYSTSKAALHMSIKFWHNQLAPSGFIVTPIHPGWVKTDMGGDDADVTVEESVKGMLKVIGGLKASDEMKLRVYDGSVLPW